MNKLKNKILISLLTIAIILSFVIAFYVIPQKGQHSAKYVSQQQNAETHDINQIAGCQTPYIGNASNVGKLFDKLPLSNTERKYEIDSDHCILTIYYLDTVWNIGETKVQQALVYNTVAAMASIDNLAGIVYKFSGDSFSFTREQIESVFGDDLAALLPKAVWEHDVQSKLTDDIFLTQFYPKNPS